MFRLGGGGGGGANRFPVVPVTITLVVINVIVWIMEFVKPEIVTRGELSYMLVYYYGQPDRIVYSAFLHSTVTPLHILFNMVMLASMGAGLEQQLGSLAFGGLSAMLILLSGSISVLADYIALVTDLYRFAPSIGYSGVLFAYWQMWVCMWPSGTRPTGDARFHNCCGVRIPRVLQPLVMVVVIQLLMSNISLIGHLSGLLAGLLWVHAPLRPFLSMPWVLVRFIHDRMRCARFKCMAPPNSAQNPYPPMLCGRFRPPCLLQPAGSQGNTMTISSMNARDQGVREWNLWHWLYQRCRSSPQSGRSSNATPSNNSNRSTHPPGQPRRLNDTAPQRFTGGGVVGGARVAAAANQSSAAAALQTQELDRIASSLSLSPNVPSGSGLMPHEVRQPSSSTGGFSGPSFRVGGPESSVTLPARTPSEVLNENDEHVEIDMDADDHILEEEDSPVGVDTRESPAAEGKSRHNKQQKSKTKKSGGYAYTSVLDEENSEGDEG